MGNYELFLDMVSDFGHESALLEALMRKGWITNDGVLAQDLQKLLPDAESAAFGCDSNCANCECKKP